MKVTVEIDGNRFTEDLGLQVTLQSDIDGLNIALSEQPGRFAWWAMLEVKSRSIHDDLEAQSKLLEAELFTKYQTSLMGGVVKSTGELKAPTLDSIRSAIAMDERMQAVQARLRKAKLDCDQLRVGRQTMEQRRDALLAIASNCRAEMEYRLVVGKRAMPGARSDARPPATF